MDLRWKGCTFSRTKLSHLSVQGKAEHKLIEYAVLYSTEEVKLHKHSCPAGS